MTTKQEKAHKELSQKDFKLLKGKSNGNTLNLL